MRLGIHIILISLLACSLVRAQSFYDDFETYDVGDYLTEESDKWVTIDGTPGGLDDVQITDENSYSGSQSIHIFGAAHGFGHDNIFLPFGGLKSSGYLKIQMRVYVVPDSPNHTKGARFYLACNNGMGFVPGIVCHLKEELNVKIHTEEGLLPGISVPSTIGEWLKIEFKINLDQNIWSVYLEDECIGTFSNPNNRINGLRILPFMLESYYIDDVEYQFDSIAPPDTRYLEMNSLRWNGDKLSGTQSDLRLGFKNLQDEIVNSTVIGLTYHGVQYFDTLTGLHIEKGEEYRHNFPKTFSPPIGPVHFRAEIISINSEPIDFDCGKFKELQFEIIKPAEDRGVLIESFTSTNCPWCPESKVMMDRLSGLYPDRFIPVSAHISDPMSLSSYENNYNDKYHIDSLPVLAYDRIDITGPEKIETEFLNRLEEGNPPVRFKIGAQFNPNNRMLDISVETEVFRYIGNDHQLLVIVTEDSVRGSSIDYAQANAFSGGQFGFMEGFENLSDPVPPAKIVYHHVPRVLPFGFFGDQGFLDSNDEPGNEKLINLSWTVPNQIAIDNLNIISAFIQNNEVMNAKSVPFEEALNNGFTTYNRYPANQDSWNLYPNPASDVAFVEIHFNRMEQVDMEIIDLNGTLVRTRNFTVFPGNHKRSLDLRDLRAGVYFVQLKTGASLSVEKLIVSP